MSRFFSVAKTAASQLSRASAWNTARRSFVIEATCEAPFDTTKHNFWVPDPIQEYVIAVRRERLQRLQEVADLELPVASTREEWDKMCDDATDIENGYKGGPPVPAIEQLRWGEIPTLTLREQGIVE
eukprot:TRINITY_DN28438_c0_g1_i1.p1 TRINITY_DN28438_c0_g1~~TRINITY_DN28438_c0_g1_i1.p1  ORF type:complete len:127 (-),score=27.91 TRINITY_DN28438_c0_g1_i1:135-515(-)